MFCSNCMPFYSTCNSVEVNRKAPQCEGGLLSWSTRPFERGGKGANLLLFVGIPHVLCKGSLDMSDVPAITV